jgi:hypothetical protein
MSGRCEREADLLPVSRVHEIETQAPEKAWLIHSIWAHSGVGIIGGAPKCCKSWLGLDMAVSVASGTPCLGRFAVEDPGPVLVYLAEDALPAVRSRIAALCAQRRLELEHLEAFVVTAPLLRLDVKQDQQRLRRTIAALQPRLLLLDPLIRLHRLDENSSADISGLLGYLRDLQRSFGTAIVLVHHVGKKQHAQPGQALRGSSDLHAFGDSNAYLVRRHNTITLTLAHRAAKPHDPIALELRSRADGTATHLEVVARLEPSSEGSLEARLVRLLQKTHEPLPRTAIRNKLKVNNQNLGKALALLQQRRVITRTSAGWTTSPHTQDPLPIHANGQLSADQAVTETGIPTEPLSIPQPVQHVLSF